MAKITGVSECLRNMVLYEKGIEKVSPVALKKAALLVQRASQLEVPVDKGILKGSAFTQMLGGLIAHVGYRSAYAIYVHEMKHLTHNIGKAKYLTDPLIDNEKNIVNIISKEMSKVKPRG